MKLSHLLQDMADCPADCEILGLQLDSRLVRPGDAFIAVNGALQHGLTHADQALCNGAVAVIYDPAGADEDVVLRVVQAAPIVVPVVDLDSRLGAIAARFYDHPSKALNVIGITGTNGKTTCSQLIAQALPNHGVIGTLGWGQPYDLKPTLNTTPDALALQSMLSCFVDEGKRGVAMEVSSHGLQLGRVNGIHFSGAVFTNLSRDHLDFHGDMTQYLNAKLRLFTLSPLRFAVVNLDDEASDAVLAVLDNHAQRWGFSLEERGRTDVNGVFARNIEHHAFGLAFDVCWQGRILRVRTPIAGAFNVQNVLTVLCVLLAMDWPFDQAVARLAHLKAVSGRMEKLGGDGKPTVYVDYAHTPDALEKVLKSAQGHNHGRLWVIFGCGGDRDKGKRPQMGHIAEICADHVVLTDDNPRSEDPQAIIADILAGCSRNDITLIHDRKIAISTVIRHAAANDCIVVAGKGHENYQEIGTQKLPFSDQAVVEQALSTWGPQV